MVSPLISHLASRNVENGPFPGTPAPLPQVATALEGLSGPIQSALCSPCGPPYTAATTFLSRRPPVPALALSRLSLHGPSPGPPVTSLLPRALTEPPARLYVESLKCGVRCAVAASGPTKAWAETGRHTRWFHLPSDSREWSQGRLSLKLTAATVSISASYFL